LTFDPWSTYSAISFKGKVKLYRTRPWLH